MQYERTLQANHPLLVEEWHEKNDKTPSQVTKSSAYKAWWKCSKCQHEWQATVNNRHNGKGCPACQGSILIVGKNDFASQKPHLLSMWNDDRPPDSFFKSGRSQVKWKCAQGHEFSVPLHKFEGSCPKCSITTLSDHSFHLLREFSSKNEIRANELSYNSSQRVTWECARCDHEWITPVYQRVNGSNCPRCALRKQSSSQEDAIAEFLTSEGIDFARNDRSIFAKELDFLVKDFPLAIEFNGLYWHSDKFKTAQYHRDKWKACRDQGIQLLTVWEDDYTRNPSLIHRMIKHKLMMCRDAVYARMTSVKELKYNDVEEFMNENHVQGMMRGSKYLGLLYDDEIVAVSVWRKNGLTLYLERYATSTRVVGGLGKLLKYAEKVYVDVCEEIVTFASHDVSDGNVYEKLGFRFDKELEPEYSYVYQGRRVHKSNFRKSRFKNDPRLLFEELMTEKELAKLNGIPRVWDTGKIRYVKNIGQ